MTSKSRVSASACRARKIQLAKYRNASRRCQLLLLTEVDRLLAWLCPFRCVLCKEPADTMDLCAACRADMPRQQEACRYCAIPLATGSVGHVCPRCRANLPANGACFAAYIYEYPLDQLITALKFHHQACMARIAGELLADYLQQSASAKNYPPPDRVVPVPLHADRCRERGYNQAELLAKVLCEKLQLQCAPDVLHRTRATATQSRLNRQQRLRNLRNAFTARPAVAGMRIALVDDVITTGATTTACVKALRRAGAVDVQVWAVARAIREAEKYS